jgi:pimeloyl-ACP methyl ester carboxylesterase
MPGELVRVLADDGLELVGYYAAPEGRTATRAVLHFHGMAGNFYENRFVSTVCDAVVSKGLAFLTVNNRGHDYRSDNLRGSGEGTLSLLGGTSFDIFEECVHDLAGASSFLADLGHGEIYFQGHSLGTVKTIHYLALTGDARAVGAILISPPDLFGLQDVRAEGRLDEVLEQAKGFVATGRGEALVESGYAVPLSAATVISMYGHPATTDLFPFRLGEAGDYSRLAALRVPVLTTFGTVDEAVTVPIDDAVNLMRARTSSAPGSTVVAIPGANHVYWGHEDELAAAIRDFVEA